MRVIALVSLGLLIALSGCSITTSVKPVGEGRVSDLCIRKNSRVLMEGFLPELEAQVHTHGVKTRTFDGDLASDCTYHLDYSANWGWDLAMYLTYAEIKVYNQLNLIGEAIYDARWGGGRLDKFGATSEKLKSLVDELFGKKPGS